MLTWAQSIWVAESYLQRAKQIGLIKGKEKARSSNIGFREIDELHVHLQAVSPRERKKRFSSAAEIGEGDHTIDEVVLDVRSKVDEHFGGSSLVSTNPVRLYRSRPKLLSEIAAEATQRFGVKVSPRLVEACVEEYRASQNEDDEVQS